MSALTATYTGITTTGVQADAAGKKMLSAPGNTPFGTYGVQVSIPSGSITSWTVTLEGSLDGANWTVITTHNTAIGSTVWDTSGKPNLFVRANVSALTLNTAPSVRVDIVAVP